MLTLIKREIEDNIVYFLGAVILATIAIAISIIVASHNNKDALLIIFLVFAVITGISMFGFCAMGAAQMYTDKIKKISSFLSTLPVTRNKIFIARVTAGILAVLTFIVPMIIITKIHIYFLSPPIPLFYGMIPEIFAPIFLMNLACYCFGLNTGWSRTVLTPTLGGLALTCILIPLVIVKGFDLHITIILLIFVISSLIFIWHKFMTTSL